LLTVSWKMSIAENYTLVCEQRERNELNYLKIGRKIRTLTPGLSNPLCASRGARPPFPRSPRKLLFFKTTPSLPTAKETQIKILKSTCHILIQPRLMNTKNYIYKSISFSFIHAMMLLHLLMVFTAILRIEDCKNVWSTNETCILIGWARSHDNAQPIAMQVSFVLRTFSCMLSFLGLPWIPIMCDPSIMICTSMPRAGLFLKNLGAFDVWMISKVYKQRQALTM